MRVLHILSAPAAAEAVDTILGLAAAGFEQAAAVAPDEPRLAELERANIALDTRILGRRCGFLRRFFTARLVRRWKPDLIHCWTREGACLVPAGKIPLVARLRGADDPKRFPPAAHFVVATKHIAAHLGQAGVSPARIDIVPAAAVLPATPPQKRASLATPPGVKILLCLARLHPDKGIDILLEALRDLPDCYLWLAGEGPSRRALETLAATLGVSDRVRFAGAGMDQAALLRAADVSVLPSRREPSTRLIALTWAGGTPLVAASVGAAAEVADGVTGLLVPPENPAALARALRRALDEDTLRQRLIAQGYAVYVRDHTRETVVRQWAELYKKIFAATKKTAAI